jgi:radial spoke head protein 4A
VILRSNRWPGSFAFAKDDRFSNVYIGYGLKYYYEQLSNGNTINTFTPPLPTIPQKEGESLKEQIDPSVEEEDQLENSLKEETEIIREEPGTGDNEVDQTRASDNEEDTGNDSGEYVDGSGSEEDSAED